ncbi:MAG: YIP1 family protein [Ignavibacteria bacterium]|nr:YIP1 family protein [Ignavibacteria bacterium]
METEEAVQPEQPANEMEELSHTDKIVGVISEPSNLFSKLVFLNTKVTDWLLPLLAMIVVAIVATFIYMSNPEIKLEMQQQQEKAMREQFEKMVESGQMTQEQVDEQLDRTSEMMNNPMFIYLFPSIGIFVMMLLWFFVFTTIGFLIAKFAFKGDGGYAQAMSAMGLPLYISVLQSIILIIVGMLMGKMITGLNPASLMGMDLKTLPGFLLSRLDVFSIWFYVVLGIAFAKMFKSDNVKKYIFTSVGVWLVFMFIIFGLGQVSPIFKNMIR